jgi:hypothetical protein
MSRVTLGLAQSSRAVYLFAASLRGRRVRDLGLLSARWRQRRVRRRLRRLIGSAREFGDARQKCLVLLAESSIFASRDSTSPFRLWALSESMPSGGIASLNQTAPTRSMPHR